MTHHTTQGPPRRTERTGPFGPREGTSPIGRAPDVRRAGSRNRAGVRLLAGAGLGSIATALLAAVGRIRPEWNVFDDAGTSLLRTWLSAQDVALTAVVLGLLGVLSAGLATTAHHHTGRWPRWLAPACLLQAAALGIGLLGMGIISVLGYLTALGMPLILVFLVVLLIRKGGRARWITLGVTAGAVAAGVGSGLLTGPAINAFAGILPAVPGAMVDVAPSAMMMATALLWLALGVQAARSRGAAGRAAAFVLRHRRVITVLAAIGPLPYALVRLSWLTPWPLLAPDGVDATTLFWGFALSVGAWAGFILTLGLIRPWGEVFPRWMPVVAGRPVPVSFAAVPGGIVAAAVSAAAVPMLQAFTEKSLTEGLVVALVMPFWFWGPMLGLAVWAYVMHRRRGRAAVAG